MTIRPNNNPDVAQALEENYPDYRWWEPGFFKAQPASSLLMQSVNPELLAFRSIADLQRLIDTVEKQGPKTENIYLAAGRVAVRALAIMPNGAEQWAEATTHMTEQNRRQLAEVVFQLT